jgi:hypothetical protein
MNRVQELCGELLRCKFSLEEIEDILRKYIPDLTYAVDRDYVAGSWWCIEDIDYHLDQLEIEDWTIEDKRDCLDKWASRLGECGFEDLSYVVQYFDDMK